MWCRATCDELSSCAQDRHPRERDCGRSVGRSVAFVGGSARRCRAVEVDRRIGCWSAERRVRSRLDGHPAARAGRAPLRARATEVATASRRGTGFASPAYTCAHTGREGIRPRGYGYGCRRRRVRARIRVKTRGASTHRPPPRFLDPLITDKPCVCVRARARPVLTVYGTRPSDVYRFFFLIGFTVELFVVVAMPIYRSRARKKKNIYI